MLRLVQISFQPPSPAPLAGLSFGPHHGPMDEKHSEAWEVSLAFLQDHRKITPVGAHCNGCGHKHRWPTEDLKLTRTPATESRRRPPALAPARRRPCRRSRLPSWLLSSTCNPSP